MDLVIGIVFGILAMVSVGINDFLIAGVSKTVGFFRASFWLYLVSSILFIFLAFFLLTSNGIDLFTLALLAVAGFASAVGVLSFTKGLEVGKVAIIATVGNTWGVITALLGFLILNEVITNFQVFDITLIIIGTILVSLNIGEILKTNQNKLHLGLEYALIATSAFGLYFFLLALLTSKLGWFSAAFLVTITTVLFLLLYGVLIEKASMRPKKISLPIFLLMGAIYIIGTLAYNLGVSYNYADIIAPINSASPLVTIILAIFLLKEKVTITQKLGMIFVLSGLVLLSI